MDALDEVDAVIAPEPLETAQESQLVPTLPTEQATPEENQNSTESSVTEGVSSKKRVKKERLPTEAELMPRPSIWPLMLALSMAVALGGFAFNLIILSVGVIMVIVSVIGWNLERK